MQPSALEVPPEVIQAAMLVGRWAKEQNLKTWVIGPCASRDTQDRYRKALVWIRSKLSCTLVPRNKWVRELHGQIWMVCQTELEPD